MPFDRATLDRVCEHIDRVQERLQRRMLLENPSTYLEFEASTMSEAEFLREVLRRTGCGLLLDVNNAYVSCTNHGRDALAYIDELPLDAVGEIHLAGFARDQDAAGAPLLIDSHGTPVDEAVWSLYAPRDRQDWAPCRRCSSATTTCRRWPPCWPKRIAPRT